MTADPCEPEERAQLWSSLGLGWIDTAYPAVCVTLGALAAGGLVWAPGPTPIVPLVLVALSVSPWVVIFLGRTPPDVLTAAGVIVPIAVIVVFADSLGIEQFESGPAQLVLMLLICIVGQTASVSDRRTVVVVTAASFAVVAAGAVVHGPWVDAAPWFVGIVLGVGGGKAVRSNIEYMARIRDQQAALARQQMEEERRRIAREVHDVVAHTMAVTMLHVTAARMAVLREPAAAVDALEEAERQGRASMDDIRQVIRLLRADDADPTAAALPRALDVEELAATARSAGLDVDLDLDGSTAELRPATALALYRVVQESLTNAVRHGGGPVSIRLSVNGDVRLTVSNPIASGGPPPRPGSGVVGMRERIEALGGSIDVGPTGGRWQVDATIPAEAV